MPKMILARTKYKKIRWLLDMMYRPNELAEDINVTVETIYRSYLPAGAPYTKDEAGQIWIYGPDFIKWADDYLSSRIKIKLGDGQAYCVHCNQAVEMKNMKKEPFTKKVSMLKGICPVCGKTVNRMVSAREGK